MKKKVFTKALALILAGQMALSSSVPAFAAGTDGNVLKNSGGTANYLSKDSDASNKPMADGNIPRREHRAPGKVPPW